MTIEQQHARMQRFVAFLVSRGLPADAAFAAKAEPGVYPNSAFAKVATGETIQVNFGSAPTASQQAAVTQAATDWDDSNAANSAWQLAADKAIVADLIDGIDRPDADPRHLTRALRVTQRAAQMVVGSLRAKVNEIINKAPIGSFLKQVDPLPAYTFSQLRTLAKQKNDAEASPTED